MSAREQTNVVAKLRRLRTEEDVRAWTREFLDEAFEACLSFQTTQDLAS